MQPQVGKFLADISEASYITRPSNLGGWQPVYLDELPTQGFTVRVISDEHAIVISFRGTDLAMWPPERFLKSIEQVITNLDYRQLVVDDSFRVHRGYWIALIQIYEVLLQTMVNHGIHRQGFPQKPVYVTGHSAGGAMATICAYLLYQNGIIAETYVYSSPRVGDSNFSSYFDLKINPYPIPLKRFEYGLDPIPILYPFSPVIAESASALLNLLEQFLPLNLSGYKSADVEYIHAGSLKLRKPRPVGVEH